MLTEKEVLGREKIKGVGLLHDPRTNKGTAFSAEERNELGLHGLLPPRILTIEEQLVRVMKAYRSKQTDLDRYIYLTALQDRNETLFYRVVMDHVQEMLAIIYTPTVGDGCKQFGHIFRRSRGLYISIEDRGRVEEVLRNWPEPDVGVIVVTDGERILGLGDLGANGMGIPIGKLSLYTALAGVAPKLCLPITLDVGTNNQEFLKDPLYVGCPHERVRGKEYDEFLDEFVEAAKTVFPDAIIQFEDFAVQNAGRLLKRYRDGARMFNDDIQGTAAVTLSGILSAGRITGKDLIEQKVLFYGAGSAATGIGHLIVQHMVSLGLSREEAMTRVWFQDSRGLVVSSRTDLADHKQPFAHDYESLTDFKEAVTALEPTVLVGVSGQGQAFDQGIVEEMARINERPVILALSNPTSKSECTAEQAYGWSKGKAIYASGSPFGPVELGGKTLVPGQGNNAYIFPGLGLGVLASMSRHVTDEMFIIAATTLAHTVSEGDLEKGCIYPSFKDIREVSTRIAVAVAECAYDAGLAEAERPSDLEAAIKEMMYQPAY